MAEDLDFPNGMVITPDRGTLIVAESTGRRLTAFTIGADGGLADRRIFADGLDGPPDGIALDADGGVWTSMTLAHQFERIVEGGDVTDRIDMGDRVAIACALGGPRAPHAVSVVEHGRLSPAPGRHPAVPAGRRHGDHPRRRPALTKRLTMTDSYYELIDGATTPTRWARSSGPPTWRAAPGRPRYSTAGRCRRCWSGRSSGANSATTPACPASSSTCWAGCPPRATCGSARRCSAAANRSNWSAPRCWPPVPTAHPGRWRAPADGGCSTLDTQALAHAAAPLPRPRTEARNRNLKARDWDRNYVHSLDWLWLTEPLSEGPGRIVDQPDRRPGQRREHDPLERLFAVADCANGIGSKLDITKWTFLNTDLAVHVFRVPDGDWIGIRAETNYGPGRHRDDGRHIVRRAGRGRRHPAVGAGAPAPAQVWPGGAMTVTHFVELQI